MTGMNHLCRSVSVAACTALISLCVSICNVCLGVSVYVSASLLDSPALSITACTALAEIGRRTALPLHDEKQHSTALDHTADQLTTSTQSTADELTTAAVVEKLVSKVKSTSENTKVYNLWLHLIMHQTIRLTGYIGPLTLVCLFVCPIV